MKPAKEKRRYQRQKVLLPLRLTEQDPKGRVLYQGNTTNVGAGGVYFQTLNWQDLKVGTSVHVVIDVPPEMFQLLPFGGMRGSGEVIRMDPVESLAAEKPDQAKPSARPRGIAVRMTSRLRFDPELHLPRFEGGKNKPN